LITEQVELTEYEKIYGDMRKAGSIASIIRFPANAERDTVAPVVSSGFTAGKGKIGIIGAGNFASSTIIPALNKAGVSIKYIASAQGLSAKILAKKAGAEKATSDYHVILQDPEVDLVIVTTRHNLHAGMVIESLKAGKSVFVEKPLCLNRQELQEIMDVYQQASDRTTLTVGFNRRFSPFAKKMKNLMGNGVMNIIATMNAGFIPGDVWVHDLDVGGGRIIGEACHFIDICSYLADSKVIAVCMNAMGESPRENTDNASILLRYANGTNAVINYFSNGSKAYSKERIEVFSQEKILILDNWRKLEGYGIKGFSSMRGTMDKGHKNQFALLNERIKKGGEPLISFESIINTTEAIFACIESLKENRWIEIN
jgi:predicted dehydrogenase